VPGQNRPIWRLGSTLRLKLLLEHHLCISAAEFATPGAVRRSTRLKFLAPLLRKRGQTRFRNAAFLIFIHQISGILIT
jgi:hypothetical protein